MAVPAEDESVAKIVLQRPANHRPAPCRTGEVLATPMLQQRMANAGIDASSSTPAELGAFVKAEIEKWTQVVRIAGIPPQ
jgi:hypothetical protein